MSVICSGLCATSSTISSSSEAKVGWSYFAHEPAGDSIRALAGFRGCWRSLEFPTTLAASTLGDQQLCMGPSTSVLIPAAAWITGDHEVNSAIDEGGPIRVSHPCAMTPMVILRNLGVFYIVAC